MLLVSLAMPIGRRGRLSREVTGCLDMLGLLLGKEAGEGYDIGIDLFNLSIAVACRHDDQGAGKIRR